MFSELKAYVPKTRDDVRYTLFALTRRDSAARCKDQDDAVGELKKHARDLNIRIIEVRLYKL